MLNYLIVMFYPEANAKVTATAPAQGFEVTATAGAPHVGGPGWGKRAARWPSPGIALRDGRWKSPKR